MNKIWIPLFALLALTLFACSEGGNQSVRCYTDSDCPVGQQCVAGNCQLPADDGPRTCDDINDCNIGEYCDNGICANIPDEPQDEPDGGEEDGVDAGDQDPGDGDQVTTDGEDGGGDEVADQDNRDFSNLNFSVAVTREGASSGPATQCVHSVRPEANAGAVLPDIEASGGYVLSGILRDANGAPVSGATVTLLSERPTCLPGESATNGSGQYSFYLPPGGPYQIQAVAPGGLAGHAEVANLSSATTRDIQLPATADLSAGPLCEASAGCAANEALGNWTLSAYYASGPLSGKLAHAGITVPAAEFTIPLESGPYYNWYAGPAMTGQFPAKQILSGTFCHDCTNCCDNNVYADRTWLRVKMGETMSGQVTAGGQGSPQSLVTLREQQDPILTFYMPTGTGGNYQLNLPTMTTFDMTVVPAMNAFGSGALLFYSPGLAIYPGSTDLATDAPIALGQQVTFSGRVIDGGGNPVANANVHLKLNEATQVEGSYNWCDPNPVVTAADGTFSVPCNLVP